VSLGSCGCVEHRRDAWDWSPEPPSTAWRCSSSPASNAISSAGPPTSNGAVSSSRSDGPAVRSVGRLANARLRLAGKCPHIRPARRCSRPPIGAVAPRRDSRGAQSPEARRVARLQSRGAAVRHHRAKRREWRSRRRHGSLDSRADRDISIPMRRYIRPHPQLTSKSRSTSRNRQTRHRRVPKQS
jgi:hypothetical protein